MALEADLLELAGRLDGLVQVLDQRGTPLRPHGMSEPLRPPTDQAAARRDADGAECSVRHRAVRPNSRWAALEHVLAEDQGADAGARGGPD